VSNLGGKPLTITTGSAEVWFVHSDRMLLQARTGAAGVDRVQPVSRPFGIATETWLVVALMIIAAALRFSTLISQSYWVDESQAAHEMQLSFGAMLSAWNRYEWNPPLYFVVLWPWAKVFGTGEAALRSFSALLGTAFVPLVYCCGRELVSRRAGLVAAALAALSPFMIWYSQEAREYMLLMVLCAGSIVCFARTWRMPSRRHLLWWMAVSGLALLTQYYAGFLVAAEGLALIYRCRSRANVAALGAMAGLELLLVPHVLPRLAHPAQFIVAIPLSIRLQQVPVTFAMNTLYQSSISSYGLIGAAGLAAALIALLVIGAGNRELRGAGLATGLAGVVLLVPLLLALLGHDVYVARGLMPAWIPLAVVIGAAATATRARVAGAALAVVLVAMFVYAQIRIDADWRFQRSDWRGVAAALGRPGDTRAIVANDGQFAAGPLSIFLSRVPWAGPGSNPVSTAPVTIGELDIVGSTDLRLSMLPAGTRLISRREVDGFQVDRLSLSRPWYLGPAAIGARAAILLPPPQGGSTVMIQRPSAR